MPLAAALERFVFINITLLFGRCLNEPGLPCNLQAPRVAGGAAAAANKGAGAARQ